MLAARCLSRNQIFTSKNIITNIVRGCSQVGGKHDTRLKKAGPTPERFPNFKTVYKLPLIRQANSFNTAKKASTMLTALGTVTSIGLCTFGTISGETVGTFIITSAMVTVWLHTLGFLLFNNLIGFIYYNEEEDKVILSYVSYWGKRVDLTVTPDNIVPLCESPLNWLHVLYRDLKVTSPNVTLKLHLGRLSHMTPEDLECAIGCWAINIKS